ncbi:MAG: tetratricopeptide repeat protein [Methanobacterium sp.]
MRAGLSTLLICSCFLFLFILSYYNSSYDLIYVPAIIFMLYGIVTGFCEFKEYYNKVFYFTTLTVLLVVMWAIFAIQISSIVNTTMYYIETGVTSLVIIGIALYAFRTWEKNIKSLEYYDNLLEINPNDVKSLNNKGVELAVQFKIEKAIECFDKVLKLDPEDATALYNKSILLKIERNPQNSKKYLYKALELDPEIETSKKSGKLLLKN